MRSSSGDELDDAALAFVTDPARLGEDSFGVYAEPVRYATTAGIAATYVVSARDLAVPPAPQRAMAARLPGPSQVVEVDAGHLLAVTRPEALAEIIRAASAAPHP